MENLTIKKSSIWGKFVYFFYSKYATDTCDLRKKLIIAGLVSLLIWPAFIFMFLLRLVGVKSAYDSIMKDFDKLQILSIFYTLGLLISVAMFSDIVKPIIINYSLILKYLILFGGLPIIVLILFSIILNVIILIASADMFVMKYFKNKRNIKISSENKPGMLKVLYTSLKEKFCKKIEWED